MYPFSQPPRRDRNRLVHVGAREYMKIDIVVHSSDSNPFYLDFWPSVSKVWNIRFGLRPLLVYIDENHDIPIDTTYGNVIKMKPVSGVPLYLQCQWVRFWIPSQFPNKVCITSDIDMFPISRSYFMHQIERIPDSKYVHINPDQSNIPVCYHIAKGSLFKKVLRLDDSWETSIRSLYAQNMGHDCFTSESTNLILKDKIQWGADEEYSTKLIRNYADPSVFVFIRRNKGRIDRSDWAWTRAEIDQDIFADSHSIRPYSQYKNEIDALVRALTE